MKAIRIHAYGDIDELKVEEAERPQPGPGEILIETKAVSINPIDWKVRQGARKDRMPLTFPAILGRDVAGRVVERGEGVPNFPVGARVMALANKTYAEFVVVKASDAAPIPDGVDDEHAATLPLVGLTGAQLIEEHVKPQKGTLTLVTGALGGVGRSAVHVLQQHDARVIAGVRKSQKDETTPLEVELAVALDDDQEIAGMGSVEAIADTLGAAVTSKLVDRVREGGVIATVLAPPPNAQGKGLRVEGFMAHPDGARLQSLAVDLAAKELEIPIARVMRFAEIREATRLAEKGAGGKIVLVW